MENNKKISLENISEEWLEKNLSSKDSFFYVTIKRLIDIIAGLIGFIFFIIFYPILGLFIKIDSTGPVLYCHKRVGKNGKIFNLCKFRNMIVAQDQYSTVWREKDKSNITRVGRILRKTHLDELPQAVNLLTGDLSFVGPRPEWIRLSKTFEKGIKFYRYRYLVKPGLFGWAQINFPASRSVQEAKTKFEYDLYYIKNRSLFLDLKIILRAIKLFFF